MLKNKQLSEITFTVSFAIRFWWTAITCRTRQSNVFLRILIAALSQFSDLPPCWNLLRDELWRPTESSPGRSLHGLERRRDAVFGAKRAIPSSFQSSTLNRYGGRELSVMACQFSRHSPARAAPMAFCRKLLTIRGDPPLLARLAGCYGRVRFAEARLPAL